jgi:hypothetical protein
MFYCDVLLLWNCGSWAAQCCVFLLYCGAMLLSCYGTVVLSAGEVWCFEWCGAVALYCCSTWCGVVDCIGSVLCCCSSVELRCLVPCWCGVVGRLIMQMTHVPAPPPPPQELVSNFFRRNKLLVHTLHPGTSTITLKLDQKALTPTSICRLSTSGTGSKCTIFLGTNFPDPFANCPLPRIIFAFRCQFLNSYANI